MRQYIIAALLGCAVCAATPAARQQTPAEAAVKPEYKPEIHGTVRAKYEYEPTIGKGRFEIRLRQAAAQGEAEVHVRPDARAVHD